MLKRKETICVLLFIFLAPIVYGQEILVLGDPNQLTVEIEIRPAASLPPYGPHGAGGINGGAEFWVDIYLVSASKKTIGETKIQLTSSPGINFLPQGISGILGTINVAKTTATTAVLEYAFPPSTILPAILPKSRMYFGSIKATKSVPGNLVFTLKDPVNTPGYTLSDANSFSYYGPEGYYGPGESVYNLKMGSIKTIASGACVYNPGILCTGKCGKIDNSCGGIVDCTLYDPAVNTCPESQVCVANQCVDAVDKVLPADAPDYDKTVLQQVAAALSNAQLAKLLKLASIVNAVKAWLAAQ